MKKVNINPMMMKKILKFLVTMVKKVAMMINKMIQVHVHLKLYNNLQSKKIK